MPLKRIARPESDEGVKHLASVPVDDDDALPSHDIREGWSAGKQTMEETSSFAQAFKPEEHMQIIKFLDDKPYANWRRHWVERQGQQGTIKRPYACPQTVHKECPLCNVGDKVQGVSSFNIAVLGDDGVPMLKTWDVGVRLFNVLSGHHSDPKVGPLTKGYFGVSQSGKSGGRGKGGQVQTNVSPISPTALKADYGMPIPSAAELGRLPKYTKDVIEIPKRSELEEVAQELAAEYD